MLKEEKKSYKSKIQLSIMLVTMLCVALYFNSFADLKIEEYFDDLKPEKHISSIYTNEKRNH